MLEFDDNSEFYLVPEKDDKGNETGFYTRYPDGISGMTISSLAKICGVSKQIISKWLSKIEGFNPSTTKLPETLKCLIGMDLKLSTNDTQGRKIIPDEVCSVILEYYAFDSEHDGKNIAKNNFRVVGKVGMRIYIWSKTGYVPSEFSCNNENISKYNYQDNTKTLVENMIDKLPISQYPKFDDEFYELIYKKKGGKFKYRSPKNRPSCVARMTVDCVYSKMVEGVYDKLKEVNPKINGKRKNRYHWHLKNLG